MSRENGSELLRRMGPAAMMLLLVLLLVPSSASAAEPPTAVLTQAVAVTKTAVELSGSIDTHEGAETSLYAQVSTDETNWEAALIESIPPGTSGASPFTYTLEQLRPGTRYFFRLLTVNEESGELASPEAPPYPEASTPAGGPVIESEHTEAVTFTEATLAAELSPEGAATRYRFQYLPEPAFVAEGWGSPALRSSPDLGPTPPDATGYPVSYNLSGLTPGEKYVWRMIAENAVGTSFGNSREFQTFASASASDNCPNSAFRLGAAAALPDCRAYELVTPTQKNGMNVEGMQSLLVASAESSASRVGFLATSATAMGVGNGGRQTFTPMLSSRSGNAWTTQSTLPPESTRARFAAPCGMSENLRFALVEVSDGTSESFPGHHGLDLIDTATGAVTPIVTGAAEATQAVFAADGIANDGSFVFFEASEAVAPEAAPLKNNLYEWRRATGTVSVVGILPTQEGGKAPEAGSFGGAYSWSTGNTNVGGALREQYVEAVHAGTSDGSQIYFTAAGTGQIYLRHGLSGPDPSTARVSAPEAGVVDPNGEKPAAFQEATPDGSRAFFISAQKLTTDAATGPEDKGHDLYVFDAATGRLADVTGGLESVGNPNGARVIALLGASASGASGYFVAEGDLGEGAVPGGRNIYRFEEEGKGTYALRFVATLSSESEDAFNWLLAPKQAIISGSTQGKASRVSADGEELVFSSTAELTGYDNVGCGVSSLRRCTEIYLFSAPAGKLLCISCDTSGVTPIGPAALAANWLNAPSGIAISHPPSPKLQRNISADGDRVFFQTPDSLVAADRNGGSNCRFLKTVNGTRALPTCLDAYEWEAPGTPGGSCTRAEVNGGCLYLLSSGQSENISDFVDASSDGADVYIATSSPLVPVDRDELTDIYDVRTDGGLASQFASPGAPCEGEACRSTPEAASSAQSPGSSNFQGAGNPKPKTSKKCKSGRKSCKKRHAKHKKKNHRSKNKKSRQKRPGSASTKGSHK